MVKDKADQVEDIQPTSLAEIKAKAQANRDGLPVPLPSGLVFRLRKPSISRLMQEGVFPNELVSSAIKLDANNLQPQTREEYLQYLQVIDTVVKRACVVPRVVDLVEGEAVPEDAITLDDVDENDRVAIFMYAQTGVRPLNKFRGEQQDGDAGSGVSKVPGETTQ